MRHRAKILSRHQEIRVLKYVGIYGVIFLAARLIWGWEASHRLAVAESELAATGVDVDAKPFVRTHSGRPNQLTALAEVAEKLAYRLLTD